MTETLNIGFTGSRKGMTDQQCTAFQILINSLILGKDVVVFHHGDCLGADMVAHLLIRVHLPRVKIHIHPPTDPSNRAFRDGDLISPEESFLERNHVIVDSCNLLIAVPSSTEIMRSGTWSTIRYARKQKKLVYILWTDGSVTKEETQ